MPKDFRRGRLPLCRTTTGRVADTIKLTVGRDIVTDPCDDKGRFPRRAALCLGWAQLPRALQFVNQKL
jgi:hypothetical protein